VAEVVALVGVYRSRNAQFVRELVQPALRYGWTTAWWALDEVVDDLRDSTVGSGSGTKLPLLNEILRTLTTPTSWLVVSDDDVAFERGDLRALVSLSARAGLDLAQPARVESELDHAITAARRLSRARLTTVVEIGPMFVVGSRWRDRIVPFPEKRGMGWGLELDWHELHRKGCVLGIVDPVRVRHVGGRGEEYDYRTQAHGLHEELKARGFGGWSDVQRTLGTWRPWQRTPGWMRT
jgi:hypothetical protein